MDTLSITKRARRLQHVASKDVYRLNLQGVYFNSHIAVATDGHCLAMVKKGEDEPTNTIVQFSKADQKFDSQAFAMQGSRGIGYFDDSICNVIDGDFPDVKKAFGQDPNEARTTICLDVDKLLKLAKALSKDKKLIVTLDIPYNALSPIAITGSQNDAAGILMPCRAEKGSRSPSEVVKDILAY